MSKKPSKSTSCANNKRSEKCIWLRIPINYGQLLGEHPHKISGSNDENTLKN